MALLSYRIASHRPTFISLPRVSKLVRWSTIPTASNNMTSTNAQTKHPILQLPLVPPEERLQLNLLPDPITPEPKSILATSHSSPSLVRRARPVLHGSHFSFLSPFPLSFPYEFPTDDPTDESLGERHQKEFEEELKDNTDDGLSKEEQAARQTEQHRNRMEEVEAMMRRYEVQPLHLQTDQPLPTEGLESFIPPRRNATHFPSARLLAISPAALHDCLPHLNVGDAFEWIKAHNEKQGPESYSSGSMASPPRGTEAEIRYQLSDYLSGRLIGANLSAAVESISALESDFKARIGKEYLDIKEQVSKGNIKEEGTKDRTLRRLNDLERRRQRGAATGYAPWSLCYAGHQFGLWAGQLGDGRAITLMETRNPVTSERWEIQLKGAGRTPYSRFADGLATFSSSVREFLASEAMAALGIPTSRSLAVCSLPDLKVLREQVNIAAITTRLCPSWLRIGSLQIHSSRSEWESVRILGEYVCHTLFGWSDVVKGGDPSILNSSRPKWARRLVEEVARRNAKTIALWQVYGFMHGVMNTDNISLLGHTIDYGPYAFMDIFDEGQICNHSDTEGRYAYRLQPTMGVFAIRQLFNAVAPLIGFELKNDRALAPGELLELSSSDLDGFAKTASEELSESVEQVLISTLLSEWESGWRRRLGLVTCEDDDKANLFDPLIQVLTDLEFSTTLRQLTRFPCFLQDATDQGIDIEEVAKQFVVGQDPWFPSNSVPEYARDSKTEQAIQWLVVYAHRLKKETRNGELVSLEMKSQNPRFVLRNWITTEVGHRLEQNNDTQFLESVLQMCIRPFEDWGLPAPGKSEEQVLEEARLCSLGQPLDRDLPSCSS